MRSKGQRETGTENWENIPTKYLIVCRYRIRKSYTLILIFGDYDTKPGKDQEVTPLVIIALQASSGLVSNAKMMYIKATSHCLIRYQSIVGKLYTIKSEDKFTQSSTLPYVDIRKH